MRANSSEPGKPESPQGPRKIGPALSLVFFFLFYLYLWLEVDLRLVYHGGVMITGFPSFFTGWDFFSGHLSHPAGMLEYLSAFLSQGFHFSWLGALIVTLQAWLIALCTASLCAVFLNAPAPHGVRFIGPILLLVLYAGYTHHFFQVTLMVQFAMLLAWGYVKARPESGRAALLLFVALHVMAYVLTAGGQLLFAALCALYELFAKHRWQLVLSCFVSAIVVPCVVGGFVFGVPWMEAPTCLLFTPLEPWMYGEVGATLVKLSLLYLFLPLTALALWLLRKRTDAATPARRLAGYAAPFAAAAVAILLYRNAETKAELAVGYYAHHRMWGEILKVVDDLEAGERNYDPCINHVANRALYHSGLLGWDMFRYRQGPTLMLLFGERLPRNPMAWYGYDTFLDLGQVNYAEFHLNGCIIYFGPRPILLKRLAFVHMVKDDIPSARVYLNALTKTLFDADWALGYLERLKSDPDLSEAPEIQHVRGLMTRKDRAVNMDTYDDKYGFSSSERMLSELLEKNPGNRMALEYLMALCMLNKRLDDLELHFSRLEPPADGRMPRLYKEAVVARALANNDRLESVPFKVGPELRARVEGITRGYQAYLQDGNPQHVAAFKGSYLYYYLCEELP